MVERRALELWRDNNRVQAGARSPEACWPPPDPPADQRLPAQADRGKHEDVLNGYRGIVRAVDEERPAIVEWRRRAPTPTATSPSVDSDYIARGGLSLGYPITGHKSQGPECPRGPGLRPWRTGERSLCGCDTSAPHGYATPAGNSTRLLRVREEVGTLKRSPRLRADPGSTVDCTIPSRRECLGHQDH